MTTTHHRTPGASNDPHRASAGVQSSQTIPAHQTPCRAGNRGNLLLLDCAGASAPAAFLGGGC
jgi:hypothetical protein